MVVAAVQSWSLQRTLGRPVAEGSFPWPGGMTPHPGDGLPLLLDPDSATPRLPPDLPDGPTASSLRRGPLCPIQAAPPTVDPRWAQFRQFWPRSSPVPPLPPFLFFLIALSISPKV